MPQRDVIVIGASAGGVEVLRTIVAGLPSDLGAAVLIVLHMAPSSPSVLPSLLMRRARLPVAFAVDGERVERGRVLIAPPDRHLVVEDDRVRVTRAPRENHSRPAVDPLFRSAALACGPRVIGVILSGRLDDGTAGLWTVKDRGGVAVVQSPDDALHADMPRNALLYTQADHVVRAVEIAPLLARLTTEAVPAIDDPPPSRELEVEVRIAMEDNAFRQGVMSLGPVSPYTCPECHGVLVRLDEGGIPRFRCHTGHAFSLDTLLAVTTETVEETLWGALRAIEESVMLLRESALRVRSASNGDAASAHEVSARFDAEAAAAEARADAVRATVLRHRALSAESVREATRRHDLAAHRASGNGHAPLAGDDH